MKIFDFLKKDPSVPEIEEVEKEKQEWKLIEKFLHTPGLKLYAYNPLTNELLNIFLQSKEDLVLDFSGEGKHNEESKYQISVNPNYIYFEALNNKNASKRVKKFKEGKIQLGNLRIKKEKETIKL